MPMFTHAHRSSGELLALSSALTQSVNAADLSAERNIVVYAFSPMDAPDWEDLPPIWHQYDGATICVNMGKFANVMTAASLKPGQDPETVIRKFMQYDSETRANMTRRQAPNGVWHLAPSREMIEDVSRNVDNRMHPHDDEEYTTYRAGGIVNPRKVENIHSNLSYRISDRFSYRGVHANDPNLLYNLLVGAIIREAGYAVFNQPVVRSDWYARATGYQRNIITVLEELRVERQQVKRINGVDHVPTESRNLIRTALPVVGNIQQVIGDMLATVSSGGEEGMSVANVALNSSLILGRVPVKTLMPYEVETIRDHVDNYVGKDRLEAMDDIWAEYVEITNANEANIMPLVRRWEALFPSADDGSNAKSSVAPADGQPQEGEGEGEGDPQQGEGKDGDEGEGEGQASGQGKGDQDGEGEGQGDGSGGQEGEGEGKDGQGKGEGADGEKGDEKGDGDGGKGGDGKYGETEQQDGNKNLKQDSGEANGGTKGAHATGIGSKNTSGVNSDTDPGAPKDEIINLPGAKKSLEADMKSAKDGPIDTIRNAEHSTEWSPRDRTPSRISYGKAKHREPAVGSAAKDAIARGREIEPTNMDFTIAKELSKVLENLNVYDRGKFTTAQYTPPGRMKSRAAVQQAAERKLQLPAQAKPWARTVRTVDMNPPLTVGVMTDISGSMGWAEQLSAKIAWILQHAVSTIAGRVACVAFGEGTTITLRPGEKMHNAQVVAANNSGEEFDMGVGTLDTMLNLEHGTGTRMLFVITDGYFVFENMMEKSRAWIDALTNKGVHIVWITPDDEAMRPFAQRPNVGRGFPQTPDKVIPVSAERLEHVSRYDSRETEQETRKLIQAVANEIQKAVRAGKSAAHR